MRGFMVRVRMRNASNDRILPAGPANANENRKKLQNGADCGRFNFR